MLSLAGIRVPVTVLVLAICLATTARGADPKVIAASHEVDVEEIPRESATSNDDRLTYSPHWPEPPNTGAMLMRLGVGTVVVLGLCVGSLWIGKPWLQRLQLKAIGGSGMSVEGSIALGNRAMLYLVRVGDTRLVAGTDAAGLKSLIAIPASFKDVLDDQFPQTEAALPTLPETAP